MNDQNVLNVSPREIVGKKVKNLRKEGVGVGSISKPDGTSSSISFDQKSFDELIAAVGESTLLYLAVEGQKKKRPVLVEEIQTDVLLDTTLNVSFKEVNLKEKVEAEVPIEVVGEVDITDAFLTVIRNEVEISALPTDLPEKITIDVSVLEKVGDSITLADLKIDTSKIELVLGDDQDPAEMPVAIIEEAQEEPEPEEDELLEGEEDEEGEAAETPEGEADAGADQSTSDQD